MDLEERKKFRRNSIVALAAVQNWAVDKERESPELSPLMDELRAVIDQFFEAGEWPAPEYRVMRGEGMWISSSDARPMYAMPSRLKTGTVVGFETKSTVYRFTWLGFNGSDHIYRLTPLGFEGDGGSRVGAAD